MKHFALFAFLCALLAAPAVAAGAAATPCSSAPYHQFDFFAGRFDVYTKSGKRFATDTVTRELNGCALLERWNGSSKGAGYSAYDAQRGAWVQTFFQDDGSVLILRGRRTDGGMLFTGDDRAHGAIEHNRILFRPLAGGGFEEYWTVSADGKTWHRVFDGFFRPRSEGGTHASGSLDRHRVPVVLYRRHALRASARAVRR